jgi:hypothetical protein
MILVGRSGAGKSTCCMRALLADGTFSAMIWPLSPATRNGGYRAQPLPSWSAFESGGAAGPAAQTTPYPLRAFFFLQHETEDDVESWRGENGPLVIERACRKRCSPLISFSPGEVSFLGGNIFANAVVPCRCRSAFRLRVSLDGRFGKKSMTSWEVWRRDR